VDLLELLELFISFVKIGFSSFGGLTMVPLINAEMLSHGWMSASQVTDIVAIAEMTPGPLGLNCATFAGMQVQGIIGAVMANLGVLTPTLTLTLTAAFFLKKFQDSRVMEDIMYGVRPASFGMIVETIIALSAENYFPGTVSWLSIAIGAVVFVLLNKFKFSIPLAIICAAALGLLLGFIPGMPIP